MLDVAQILKSVNAYKSCPSAMRVCFLYDFLRDTECDVKCWKCNFNACVTKCKGITEWV